MIYAFIATRCGDLPVTVCCSVMGVSRSGYYQRLNQPITAKELGDAWLANDIFDIWKMSRHAYGSPRVRAELRLGRDIGCSKRRVERLMRDCGAVGLHYRTKQGCTVRSGEPSADDLVNRNFDPDGPDRLWVTDITEHRTDDGKVYLAVVLDAWSRRVIGWSIADHIRAELVADALQMAIWRRNPQPQVTITHSDHGAQGGFKWSSQHLDMEVFDGSSTAESGSSGSSETSVAWPSEVSA